MADLATVLDQVEAGAGADVLINELLDACSPAANYARRGATCVGLTWGYFGGRWSGFNIANGTLSLTASATNYITVKLSDGTVDLSTSNTHWNDTANYARAYIVTTGTSAVTGYDDYRAGLYGTQFASPTGLSPVGKHSVPVMSAAMVPTVTNGCNALAQIATSANKPDILTLDFPDGSTKYAQFSVPMPKSWNEGTLTARFIWSHPSTTTNFGVTWQLEAVAVRNGVAIATSYGTAQLIADTGGTTDTLYVSDELPALTVGNSPQAEDLLYFRVARVPSDASDTMAVAARLHAVILYMTTDAANDA